MPTKTIFNCVCLWVLWMCHTVMLTSTTQPTPSPPSSSCPLYDSRARYMVCLCLEEDHKVEVVSMSTFGSCIVYTLHVLFYFWLPTKESEESIEKRERETRSWRAGTMAKWCGRCAEPPNPTNRIQFHVCFCSQNARWRTGEDGDVQKWIFIFQFSIWQIQHARQRKSASVRLNVFALWIAYIVCESVANFVSGSVTNICEVFKT